MLKNINLAPAFALVDLTGILPIVWDETQSKLNLFTEYSMTDAMRLTEFVGFTEDETESLCEQHGMSFDECRSWYNGYKMADTRYRRDYWLYNPKSVVTAMMNRNYGDYWTQTSSYDALKIYIMMNFEGIREDVKAMIAGEKVEVNVYEHMNTMTDFRSKDDVFTYLIHPGYLGYERDTRRCYIPNFEIRSEWISPI